MNDFRVKFNRFKETHRFQVTYEDLERNKIIKAFEDHLAKNVDRVRIDVDKPTTSREREAISAALNEFVQDPSRFGPKKELVKGFRLEQAKNANKGSGQWEIQRNGEKGKTNVAEVIAVDGFQGLINHLPSDPQTTLQYRYNRLLSLKLIESLNSAQEATKSIELVRIGLGELADLFQ